jgi:hypothetical protein
MRRIIYTQANGGVAIVHPVINTSPVPEEITEEEAVARALAKLPPDAIDPQIIDEADIPADRSFRDAWSRQGGRITHDMAKAREIHRCRLRAARAPLLAALDIEYQRADERDDVAEKAGISARKQALRDVTAHPDIAHAATIERLKALTIPSLTGEPPARVMAGK